MHREFIDVERQTIDVFDEDKNKYVKETIEQHNVLRHCPLNENDIICTALVQKVNELNEYALDNLNLSNVEIHTIQAHDSQEGKFTITDESHRAAIDKSLTNMKRSLTIYEGMVAILTINKDTLRNYVNGTVGTIVKIHLTDSGNVACVDFLPDDAVPGSKPLLLYAENSFPVHTRYSGFAIRTQFPLLPCSAVTVHRLQGATIEPPKRLHVLLNKEIFETGQAYVAMSRVRSLSQLHIWCLDLEAF